MPRETKTAAIVVGTRPEAIKMAPLIGAFRNRADRWQVKVIATAQHREMLDQVFKLFDIEADYDLDIMKKGQNLYDVTERALRGLGDAFADCSPDLVLVQGDTTTTFAGALAAFYQQIPVGHVEAGLRTGRRYSPFPEEINRRLSSALSTFHFPPTQGSAWNLRSEGIDEDQILVTGNTVIDALLDISGRESDAANDLQLPADLPLVLITAHRRESFGAPLEKAFSALARLAKEHGDHAFVYPVHPNPNVSGPAGRILGAIDNLHLIAPLDYEPFVHMMKRARLIITDSGGVQEEAPSLGVPVLVLREVTERPEAVDAGTVKLVGTDPERIYFEANRLLIDTDYHDAMSAAVNPYGDGKASERIEAFFASRFFEAAPPAPFSTED